MLFRKPPFILLAAFLIFILPAAAQVIPAAQEGNLPLSVGVGASSYFPNYGVDANGHRRPIEGGTLWIDWQISRVPHILNGIGVEVAARDLSLWGPIELSKGYGDYNCPIGIVPPNCQPNPSGLRFDTAEGGLIYRYHRYARIHPLVKMLAGFGNSDFPADTNARYPSGRLYTHDTRNFFAADAGLEYRILPRIDIRGEYEYQFWPDFHGHNYVKPNGLTVGVLYSFKPYYHHKHLE
jgi:opacity protein-like surface antigen